MLTMCHKVIVSVLLFTLNSAAFYIYCVRINRFIACPISAPAYFSPCGHSTTRILLTVLIIRCWFQMLVSKHFVRVLYTSSYMANLTKTAGSWINTQLLVSCRHDRACLSVRLSVSQLVCLPIDTFFST